VLQKTMGKLLGGERTQLELASVRSAVTKGAPIILQYDQAAVADGKAEDVRSQVLEGGSTSTTSSSRGLMSHGAWK
jgi:hypothetical protein